MSYNIKPKVGTKSGPITGNRVQNVESTLRLIKEVSEQDNKFYELEPLEVLEVHLDDTKNSFPQGTDGPDYTYLGGVKGRFVISEIGLNIDRLNDYKPLNPSIQTTPVVGEIVIGVKYLGQLFYTTQVNFFGNPNFNTQHGLSRGKVKDTLVSNDIDTANEQNDLGTKLGYYLEPTQDVRRLLPQEGDVLIEGRFGNTIRIGSDIKNENAKEVYNILVKSGKEFGISHCGAHTMDTMRMESGFLHWEHDISPEENQYQAGLNFTISFKKKFDFIGRDKLLKIKDQKLDRRFIMLVLKDNKAGGPLLLHEEPIYLNNDIIGKTTSGNYSFNYNKNLSFGYINSNISNEEYKNKDLYIEVEKKKYKNKIILKPLNQNNFKSL